MAKTPTPGCARQCADCKWFCLFQNRWWRKLDLSLFCASKLKRPRVGSRNRPLHHRAGQRVEHGAEIAASPVTEKEISGTCSMLSAGNAAAMRQQLLERDVRCGAPLQRPNALPS